MAGRQWAPRAQGALRRYRVMAWVTGVMLLLLTLHIALQVGQAGSVLTMAVFDEEGLSVVIPGAGTAVPFAHGWIYVVYLVTVVDVWSTMRWGLGRLVAMVLAGVVPVLSFVVERRVHAAGDAQIASGRPGRGTAAPAVGPPL